MSRCFWCALAALTVLIGSGMTQERWALRFTVREGMVLHWHIRTTDRQLVNMRAQMIVTEMWVQERIESVRPNGNLVWGSQVIRCVVNGQVVPPEELEATETELTPLGYPAHPFSLPPPSLDRVNEWLADLLGSVSLVFPATEVSIGDRWQHHIMVGLKPPNEPRRLTVTYRLEGAELVAGGFASQRTATVGTSGDVPPSEPKKSAHQEVRPSERGHKCLRISVTLQAPVRLVWQWRGASVTINGGAKLEGVFWFDPQLGAVRQRRATLTISYTREAEQWDGLQFAQRTQFVNRTIETEARLLAP